MIFCTLLFDNIMKIKNTTENKKIDALIHELTKLVSHGNQSPYIKDILTSIAKFALESSDSGDVKIINTALYCIKFI